MAIEMGCQSCHNAPHKKEKPELSLADQPPGLCYMCHDSSGFGKASVHSAVAAGMCTSCHNPHSSGNEKLLTGAGSALCFQCHDSAIFTKATQHNPVAEGQCTFCHNPHSADNAKNLEFPASEICMNCHDMKGAHVLNGLGFGDKHPLSGVADPSNKGHDISCMSCHSPHSSGYASLLEFEGVKNLCLKCHKKSYLRF